MSKDELKETNVVIEDPILDNAITKQENAVIMQAFDYELMKMNAQFAVKPYLNMVITEENLKEASDARATLNKKVKEIDAERIRVKKAWNEPVVRMEAEIKKVLDVYSEAINVIDAELKSYEAERIQKVRIEINDYFSTLGFDFVPLNRIYDDRWTNKGSANTWKQDMENKIFLIKKDIELIETVGLSDVALNIALNRYADTLQATDAIKYARMVTEPAPKKTTPTEPEMKPQPVEQKVETIETYEIAFANAIDFMEAINVLTEAKINFKVIG